MLAQNRTWAANLRSTQPSLLAGLAKGQSPPILWIGCSDSRVPETTLLGCQPGDVFVHRNIANVLTPGDLSSGAAIEYAVNALGVQHVVLCGHAGCGGVAAALANKHIGLIDAWLMPLRRLRYQLAPELEGLGDKERVDLLVRENVRAGVQVLRENPNVIRAVRSRGLEIHGVVYDIATGDLEELDVAESKADEERRNKAFAVE